MSSIKSEGVTYIPATQKFYAGVIEKDMNVEGRHGQVYHEIAKLNLQALKKGDRENAVEYTDNEMVRRADRYLQAQSGDNFQADNDIVSLANMTRVELLTEIINRQYKNVYLINGVRKVPVPKLRLDYDIQIHLARRGKQALVPKRQRPETEMPEFVQASFDLVKYGKLARIIDTTDEDELSALISPLNTALEDLAQVLSQDENLLIRDDGLETFGNVSGADWSARNASGNGFSTNNPLDQISTELERIVNNHGKPDTIVTNMRQFGTFKSNSFLIGFTEALDRENEGGMGSMPGFPGLRRITDSDIASNLAYVYDSRALSYGEGPMITESFRDPKAGVSGHVVRKWVQPVVPVKFQTAWGSRLISV
jgi:hypothetical protein